MFGKAMVYRGVPPFRTATSFRSALGGAAMMCAALALLSAPAMAELPPLSPGELEMKSSAIVTGHVLQVYTAERTKKSPGLIDTVYAIEIDVQEVKKGDGIQQGETVFVRTWKAKRRPRGWAGPGGQSTIPKPGQTITVYLTQKNGAYDVLIPNGLSVKP